MCKLGVISQERLKIEIKLLLSANRKSYMPRRLALSSASRAISAVAELLVLRALCRAIDELLTCMRSSVSHSCGDVAGHWLFSFKSLIMLPVQYHLGCSNSAAGALH